MRKKEDWMKRGAQVLANGKPGVITSMQENTLNGLDYVYYISVKITGEKWSNKYHPNDVEKFNQTELNLK